MTEIFTAKTIDEAKAMAVKKFGKKPGEIKFEVIEEGKKGFLGLGQVDAKVKATYVEPAMKPLVKKEQPKPQPKPAVVAEPKPEPVIEEVKEQPVVAEKPVEEPEEVKEVKEAAPAPEPVVEEKPEEKPVIAEEKPVEEAPEVPEVEVKEESKEEPKEEKKAEVKSEVPEEPKDEEISFSLEDYTLVTDESTLNEKVKIARDYITSVLRAMGVDAEYDVYQNETGVVIDIKSDNNGTIIGRRGETLDSLQYLCSIIANKGDKDYFRITIDCLGYRNKRKDTLKQLAEKVAKSVLKSGRPKQLEPMNPYERRVIHSAISEIEGVSSRSIGEEPYRKIIISPNNPKNNKRRGNRRDDRKGGNNRRNDKPRNTNREPIEVKAIDLSTSFEKDYKKPKPEDSMDIGLYGKIEF